MKMPFSSLSLVLCAIAIDPILAAEIVPTDIQQPGTQPQEISNLESPDKCDNCHGGYNLSVEPSHNWRGSMMAHAGRDPIFWATLAIAEQDFLPGQGGAGDLCIRCHSTAGWLGGRSTPTDGSGLAAGDSDGVECEFCHKATNTDNSEHPGVMIDPFLSCEDDGAGSCTGEGYYGSGMASMWPGSDKLGPYIDAEARHQWMPSDFHRSVDFCGTCHDVSNPAVGDLAHNHGAQLTADPVVADGTPGNPVDGKAAFNNPPYKYGIVERTFSEYKSGLLSETLVSDYLSLPEVLRAGALKAAYESALVAGTGGNYEDGTPRYFSCQTCHMRPVNGPGCNKKGAPVRKDLPLHDMTGGNYWMPVAIQYLDSLGKLRLGGGLTAVQITALDDGITRAKKQLNQAASLLVEDNTLKVINHSGHKLISGYPEGRRMWLNIKWFDADNNELTAHEIGAYGPLTVKDPRNPGDDLVVETLRDLHDPYVFEAHMGMTKEWAVQLVNLGYDPELVLSYDRITGDVEHTLGNLATSEDGVELETFHFVLNNTVTKDNRIPPYGMRYDIARVRNALPVPAVQYGIPTGADGNPLPGGIYNYWAEIPIAPPAPEAVYAKIDLLYQPTSWEYIQFLYLANNGSDPAQGGNAFLGEEGVNMLDAWLNAGADPDPALDIRMAKPYVMASTVWGDAPIPQDIPMYPDALTTWSVSKAGDFGAPAGTFNVRDTVGIRAHITDESAQQLSGAQVFLEIHDAGGAVAISLQGFSDDAGNADMRWKTGRREATGISEATVTNVIKNGYNFDSTDPPAQTTVVFNLQ